MANKTESIPPLIMTQNFTRQYPDIWDDIDLLREETMAGKIDAPWDFDLCYCPIAVSLAALQKQNKNPAETTGKAGFAAACAAWRRTKMIYRFDDTLAEELFSMADDIVIPSEILRSLPAPAIYIQFREPSGDVTISNGERAKIDGFLVHIEDDVKTREKELRIDYLTTAGTPALPIYIHLIPGGTIGDGIEKAAQTAEENLKTAPLTYERKQAVLKTIRSTNEIAQQAIQLVLYICAENAEIEENEAQAKIYRKSDRITDRYRELRKWDVGVKTGVILRAKEKREREESRESAETEGTPRTYNRIHKTRPHVRRAHWHHFWTGSGENKKLILRWVNTTLVNADEGELPPTVIPLK